jgi:amino acid transporter
VSHAAHKLRLDRHCSIYTQLLTHPPRILLPVPKFASLTPTPGSFGLTGYDAVSHMVEEMPRPHINAPRVMVAAVCIGASSSFIFLICLLFSIKDVESVNSSSAGALLESMYQATGSRAGAVCLQVRLHRTSLYTGLI